MPDSSMPRFLLEQIFTRFHIHCDQRKISAHTIEKPFEFSHLNWVKCSFFSTSWRLFFEWIPKVNALRLSLSDLKNKH